jgi:hypothetical protein
MEILSHLWLCYNYKTYHSVHNMTSLNTDHKRWQCFIFICPTPIRRSVFHGLQDLRKIEAVRGDSINGMCLLHGCEYP